MKISVFEGRKEEEELILRLEKNNYGAVTLIAVDSTGKKVVGGNILSIEPNGKLRLIGSVSDCIGLMLDKAGKIELCK